MSPEVLNKRDVKGTPVDAVYVGRPTKWGNPFVIGPDGDRITVIEKYNIWLHSQLHQGRLDLEELRGKDLICWCAPLACHADILLEEANKDA